MYERAKIINNKKMGAQLVKRFSCYGFPQFWSCNCSTKRLIFMATFLSSVGFRILTRTGNDVRVCKSSAQFFLLRVTRICQFSSWRERKFHASYLGTFHQLLWCLLITDSIFEKNTVCFIFRVPIPRKSVTLLCRQAF